MNKYTWEFVICLSLISIGVNLLTHSHDTTEIISFLGGWAVTTGFGIIAAECFIAAVRQYALWQLPHIRESVPDPDAEALSWLYVARARLDALIAVEVKRSLESKSENTPRPGGLESG